MRNQYDRLFKVRSFVIATINLSQLIHENAKNIVTKILLQTLIHDTNIAISVAYIINLV